MQEGDDQPQVCGYGAGTIGVTAANVSHQPGGQRELPSKHPVHQRYLVSVEVFIIRRRVVDADANVLFCRHTSS